jgi:hypothetical protein
MSVRINGKDTVQALVDKAFAQPGNVYYTALEANGVIVGGVLVVRGERAFDAVKALLPPVKKEGQ